MVLQILQRAKESGTPLKTVAKHKYDLYNGNEADDSQLVNLMPSTNNRFAVIAWSGSQYKVTVDDLIVGDIDHSLDIGQTVELNKVR